MRYSKDTLQHMSEDIPDSKASKRFRQPPAYKTMDKRQQVKSTNNRTLRELIDYMIDGINSGRISGTAPVSDDVIEYIHGGNIDTSEYLADKYNISGGDDVGQEKIKAVQVTCERGAKA